MTVTINNVRAQFHLSPPIITFLQGANMGVPTIRNTLRQIEETEEGRGQSFRQIVTASGNLDFSENMDGSSASALTIRVLAPYVCAFEAGPIPFNSTLGNILFTSVQSPGAVVKINNAVGAMLVSTGGLFRHLRRSPPRSGTSNSTSTSARLAAPARRCASCSSARGSTTETRWLSTPLRVVDESLPMGRSSSKR